jgi:hypothetical protein
VRDQQRAAEGSEALQVVVAGFGGVLTGKRKRTGVEGGVIDGDADAAVVERTSALAVIAESGRLGEGRGGSVVDAAVDEQAFGRALIGLGGIVG